MIPQSKKFCVYAYAAMPFHHRFRNRDNLFASWGGKKKKRKRKNSKLFVPATVSSSSIFYCLSMLTELSQIWILLGWLPKQPVTLRAHWCSPQKVFLHLMQITQALFYPPLPSSVWAPPYSLWQLSFWKYSGCAFGVLSCALHQSNLRVGIEFLAEIFFFLLTVQKSWQVWEWVLALSSPGIQKISLDKIFSAAMWDQCRHRFYSRPRSLIR